MARVGVLGTGTMGPQIAAALAVAGYPVDVYNHEHVDETLPKVSHALRWYARKNLLKTSELESVLSKVSVAKRLEDLAQSTYVIEAVIEDMAIKQELFKELDRLCTQSVFIASNTSSLDISTIGKFCQNPARVIGLHFFNPILETQLVEVITTAKSDDRSTGEAIALVHSLNKTPISVPQSCVNRILIPMINEACFALEQGLTSAEDIDRALRLGANHPIGPLGLADLIGIDVVIAILETFQAKLGTRYKPAAVLLEMAQKGHLGRKTGQGFFSYGRPKKAAPAQ